MDGTIVGIDKVIIAGRHYGQTIDIQPTLAPSLVVTVANLAADPSLSVGSMVTSGSSKLGELLDLSRVQQQELARYTNDAGNHVLVEVHPASTPELVESHRTVVHRRSPALQGGSRRRRWARG